MKEQYLALYDDLLEDTLRRIGTTVKGVQLGLYLAGLIDGIHLMLVATSPWKLDILSEVRVEVQTKYSALTGVEITFTP